MKAEEPSDAPYDDSDQAMSEDQSQVDIEDPAFGSSSDEKPNEEESVPCNVNATEDPK